MAGQMSSQMAADVLARIRALPGNTVCADCSNLKPQWASVSYGTLVCLECSGHHRSLGVHLSFVRSVAMDSWTERQIRAMEMCGGNAAVVEFFNERNINKDMSIPQKYNSKQAEFFRNQLAAKIDGKQGTMADPGRYDPRTAAPVAAQGMEPLLGESTDEYNARQARLREEARERMRAKFGNSGGGMGGVGSNGSSMGGMGSGGSGGNSFDDGEGLGGFLGGAVGAVGGIAGAGWGLLREKVIDNENVRDRIGGLGQLAGSAIGSVRQTVRDGDVIEAFKRNASLQEGSAVRESIQWGTGTAGNVWDKGGFSDFFVEEPPAQQSHQQSPQAARSTSGSFSGGARPTTSSFGGKAAKKADLDFDFDDDWGQDAAPATKDPTKDDMARMAKEMGMSLGSTSASREAPIQAAPKAATMNGGYPAAAAAAPAAPKPKEDPDAAKMVAAIKAMDLKASAPKPEPKKKAGLQTSDDFFADFDM